MSLDLWIAIAVAGFGLMGLLSGAIKQAAQWLALALAYLVIKPVSLAAAPQLAPKLGLPAGPGPLLLTAGLMLGGYFLGSLAFKALLVKLLPAREKTRVDRLGGLALGAAKGTAVAWVLLSVIISFGPELAKAGFDLDKKAGGSSAVAFTRRHNLFDTLHLPALENAKKLAQARSDPRAAQALLDNPAMKAALSDPALRQAITSRDPAAALQNPELRKLLSDPELMKAVEKLENAPGAPGKDNP